MSITIFRPSACSCRIASTVVALIGSATPSRPAGCAVDGHEHHRLAVGAQRLGALGKASVDVQLLQQGEIAERHGVAVHGARHALAADSLEVGRFQQVHASRRGPRHDRRRQRDARCRARGSRPGAARWPHPGRAEGRPPPVSVCPRSACPVLSTTSVSTLRSTSIASAFLNSTPTLAPFAGRRP